MSEWTHSICVSCWIKQNPGRVPVMLIDAPEEPCCFCGDEHQYSIYTRRDPKDPALKCGGEHDAARSSAGRAVGLQAQSVEGSIPSASSIVGPFTRIAPDDYSKMTFLGRTSYFDTAQMGWEFYYSAAKEKAARLEDGVPLTSVSHPPGWEFRIKGFLDRVRKKMT